MNSTTPSRDQTQQHSVVDTTNIADLQFDTYRAPITDFTLGQALGPLTESHLRGELGIHVLVGKLRRPQQSDASDDGAAPQYHSLWAYVRRDRATLSYDAFKTAVSASVIALVIQEPDKDALTLFHPIGKYIS